MDKRGGRNRQTRWKTESSFKAERHGLSSNNNNNNNIYPPRIPEIL